MLFSIDTAIVTAALSLTLLTGVYCGRNVQTVKDYALGGRNFSTATLVATIVATWASGSGFFLSLSRIYSQGFSYFFADLGFLLSPLIVVFIFIPRMEEFLGKNSIAEAMGDLYGKNVRSIIAVTGVLASIGKIAVQFAVFGTLFSFLANIPTNTAIIAAGVITTLYSAFGGIRSVTFTDLLQFIIFGFIIPMLGVIIWNDASVAGFDIGKSLMMPKFNASKILSYDNPHFWETISLFFYFAIPHMKPAWFQRVSMGRDIAQVRQAFLIAVAILFFVMMAIAWIPFLLWNINPNIESKNILGHIIETYSYPGIKGLILAAVISMAMSTSDSYINSASVLFANDFLIAFKNVEKHKLLYSRIFAIFLGIGSIILAISASDLLDIVIKGNIFYFPLVTPVLFLTMLGFRSTTKSVLYAMSSGLIVVIFWQIMGYSKINGMMCAVILNTATFLITHYALKQKGGWKTFDQKKVFMNNKQTASELLKSLPKNLIKFCKKKFPTDEVSYMGLGIYLMIYAITTMYSTQLAMPVKNSATVLLIFQIVMISGVVLSMYPIWPNQIKNPHIMQAIWPIIIFLQLIIFGFFFVMISNFGQLQFAIFTTNVLVSITLLGWRIGSPLVIIGFYFSLELYKFSTGLQKFDFSVGSPLFLLMYSLVILGATMIIFLKPQQEYLAATEEKAEILDKKSNHLSARVEHQEQEIKRLSRVSDVILNNVNHELRLPITGVINFSEMIDEQAQKLGDEYIQMLSRDLNKSSLRLSTMMLSMLDLATFNARKIELKKEKFDISQMVRERIELCKKIYLEDKPIDFKLHLQSYLPIVGDKNYLMQVIDNLITNSINYSDGGVIDIRLYFRVDDMIEFAVIDEGKGISDDELESVFRPFKVGSRTSSPAGGRGLGLSLCKAVIESHGGSIRAFSRNKGAHISFLLPS